MPRWMATAYGLGRLAFGIGLIAAPEQVGSLLLGDQARETGVRVALRTYGTRDVVLGGGVLATNRAGDPSAWIKAGIASDILDAALQVAEWKDLPAGKRELGVAMAAGAAASGVALLFMR